MLYGGASVLELPWSLLVKVRDEQVGTTSWPRSTRTYPGYKHQARAIRHRIAPLREQFISAAEIFRSLSMP